MRNPRTLLYISISEPHTCQTPLVFANVVYLCYKIGEHQIEPRQCD